MRAALMLMLFLAGPLAAQESKPVRSHGLTILGAPALPANFPHFPYVNPAAPKGGEVAFAMTGSFDGFNPYILRGNPAFGTGAAWQPGVGGAGAGTAGGHVWESLLVGSADEVATAYGHLAETIELAGDRMWVAFELRPEARFADGQPVTAEDVVWTYSGVRPLLDDESGNPAAVTRDYRLELDTTQGAPLLSVWGGKITTFRKLAEEAADRLVPVLGRADLRGPWTAAATLPGGDLRAALGTDAPRRGRRSADRSPRPRCGPFRDFRAA